MTEEGWMDGFTPDGTFYLSIQKSGTVEEEKGGGPGRIGDQRFSGRDFTLNRQRMDTSTVVLFLVSCR
jgi:hypothetical protein